MRRYPQLVPFNFIREIMGEVSFSITDPSTWIPTLKCADVYEAFFNLLLTVPLGLFVRYFFRCRWWQALLIGFGMTLFYETSQLTGLWGIYAHPYRLFDVDDLIVNTLGAMVGFWIADPLTRHLPDIDELNEESMVESATYTTFTRRLLAFAFDLVPVAAVFAAIALLAPGLLENPTALLIAATVTTGIFFMLVPVITDGATLGDKVLELRIVRPDGSRASRWQCALRYLLLFWVFLLIPLWANVLLPDTVEGSVLTPELFSLAIVMFYAVWGITVIVRAIRSAKRHPFIMLNGMISHTRIMSIEQSASLRKIAHAEHAAPDGAMTQTAPDDHGERAGHGAHAGAILPDDADTQADARA